jgi:hypothetical protein
MLLGRFSSVVEAINSKDDLPLRRRRPERKGTGGVDGNGLDG